MRVVMQRVTSASVRVEGEVVGQIGKGLLCLVGVERNDTEEDAEFCCRRLLVRFIRESSDVAAMLSLTDCHPLALTRNSRGDLCAPMVKELPHLAGRQGHALENLGALQRPRGAAREPVHAARLLLRQQARLPPQQYVAS